MFHQILKFKHDQIVYGSCLRSMLFAYIHNAPILFEEIEYVERYEYMSKPLHDRIIKIFPNIDRSFQSLWEHLYFLNSINGLILFDEYSKLINIKKKSISGFLQSGTKFQIKYNKCNIFDAKNVSCYVSPKFSKHSETLIRDRFSVHGKYFLSRRVVKPPHLFKKIILDQDALISFCSSKTLNIKKYDEAIIKINAEEIVPGINLRHERRDIIYCRNIQYQNCRKLKFIKLSLNSLLNQFLLYHGV